LPSSLICFSRYYKELKFGPLLGVGGFCRVSEVFEVKLSNDGKDLKKKQSDDDMMAKAAARRLATVATLKEDDFYDISEARELMAKNFDRNGDARYAVKCLHEGLDVVENARGKIDLAIEAKYLSVVSHPNIIKMRGWASCDPLDDKFFLILDRLYDTLLVRMGKWQVMKKKTKGLFGLGSNKEASNDLMRERLLVAYDVSAAFRYLHENR